MFGSKKDKENSNSSALQETQSSELQESKEKKPKKKFLGLPIWAWVVIVIIIIGVIGGSGDSSSSDSSSAAKQEEEQKQEEVVEEIETQDEPQGYVNTAVQATIYTGSWTVPEEIQPGHYTITAEAGSGNLFIYDEKDNLETNEMLGSDTDLYIDSYTTYLEDGYRIEISGIDSVLLTPTDPTLSTSKGSGIYIVGQDIPAGSYNATAVSGSGNFFVYSSAGRLKTNEMLGVGDTDFYVSKVKVTLKDGDVVEISGLNQVDFVE